MFLFMFNEHCSSLLQVNQSSNDWLMEATIEGTGFTGPSTLVAKAFGTTFYPLIFSPQKEGTVQV